MKDGKQSIVDVGPGCKVLGQPGYSRALLEQPALHFGANWAYFCCFLCSGAELGKQAREQPMFAHLLAGQDECPAAQQHLAPQGCGDWFPRLLFSSLLSWDFLYLPDHPGMPSIHPAHVIPVHAGMGAGQGAGSPASLPALALCDWDWEKGNCWQPGRAPGFFNAGKDGEEGKHRPRLTPDPCSQSAARLAESTTIASSVSSHPYAWGHAGSVRGVGGDDSSLSPAASSLRCHPPGDPEKLRRCGSLGTASPGRHGQVIPHRLGASMHFSRCFRIVKPKRHGKV